jgi:hypothetical protein
MAAAAAASAADAVPVLVAHTGTGSTSIPKHIRYRSVFGQLFPEKFVKSKTKKIFKVLCKAILTQFVPTLDVPEGKMNKNLLKMPTVATLSQPVSENF